MTELQYDRFLSDPVQYQALATYWKSLWQDLLEFTGTSGLWRPPAEPARFANGTLVMDGNPILAAESVSLRKAVRIIQHDAGEADRLVVWTDQRWDEHAGALDELVICLYLDPNTEAQARQLLTAWLTGDRLPMSSRSTLTLASASS